MVLCGVGIKENNSGGGGQEDKRVTGNVWVRGENKSERMKLENRRNVQSELSDQLRKS